MTDQPQHGATPWWLMPGTEFCEFCLHTYQFEVGYYCVECDGPVCPLCVIEVRATRRVVCPNCYGRTG